MRHRARSARWIGVLAVLGVLLNATAVVRHAAHSAGALLAHGALLADLALLCHGGAAPRAAVTAELRADVPSGVPLTVPPIVPYVPPPADAHMGCAVCCWPGHAVALPVREVAGLMVPQVLIAPMPRAADRVLAVYHAARPFARGPPAPA